MLYVILIISLLINIHLIFRVKYFHDLCYKVKFPAKIVNLSLRSIALQKDDGETIDIMTFTHSYDMSLFRQRMWEKWKNKYRIDIKEGL